VSGLEEETRSCCPLEHQRDGARPRPSTAGTVFCVGHKEAIYRVLGELSTFEQDADELIEAGTARHDTAPLTGNGEKPLPINLNATDLRLGWTDSEGTHAGVRATFVSWVKFTADERSLALPEDTLTALSAFLRKHHDFLVGHELAEGYASEILTLGRKAHALLNPSGRRRFTSKDMWCREVVEGEPCIGSLWALLTPEDPYAEVANEVVCDICGFALPINDLLMYARQKVVREAA
jgi:hypothetical protein